jgi:hypothetical protein
MMGTKVSERENVGGNRESRAKPMDVSTRLAACLKDNIARGEQDEEMTCIRSDIARYLKTGNFEVHSPLYCTLGASTHDSLAR